MRKTVFFDLDGTLTDPKVGITRSIQYALGKFDTAVPPADELTWCIGPPLMESFKLLLDEARSAEALAHYRERFAQVGWLENLVYPGVITTLTRLCEADYRLFVATSKPHVFARKIITHFQMDQYFEVVYGAELDGTRSDKSELLKFALTDSQSDSSAIMIGDRLHDIKGALANGMSAIGVTYGYGTEQELLDAGASRIVNQSEDIVSVIASISGH